MPSTRHSRRSPPPTSTKLTARKRPEDRLVRTRAQALTDCEALCERIEQGETVTAAKRALHLSWEAITRYCTAPDAPLRERYARARERQAHVLAEAALECATQPYQGGATSEAVQARRLEVDTRKWLASKVLPRIYGERITQEHTGEGGGPVSVTVKVVRESKRRTAG